MKIKLQTTSSRSRCFKSNKTKKLGHNCDAKNQNFGEKVD